MALTQVSNKDITLTRSEKGKPLLVRDGVVDSSIGFNISHQVCSHQSITAYLSILFQGDYVVLATEEGTPGKPHTDSTPPNIFFYISTPVIIIYI